MLSSDKAKFLDGRRDEVAREFSAVQARDDEPSRMVDLSRVEQLQFGDPQIQIGLRHERCGIRAIAVDGGVRPFEVHVRLFEPIVSQGVVRERQHSQTVVAVTCVGRVRVRDRVPIVLLPGPQPVDEVVSRGLVAGDTDFVKQREPTLEQPQVRMDHRMNFRVPVVEQELLEQFLRTLTFAEQPQTVSHPPSNRGHVPDKRIVRPEGPLALHQHREYRPSHAGIPGPQRLRSRLEEEFVDIRPPRETDVNEYVQIGHASGFPQRLGDADAGHSRRRVGNRSQVREQYCCRHRPALCGPTTPTEPSPEPRPSNTTAPVSRCERATSQR